MALPQIKTPEFVTSLPSTGEKIVFRPFLVKEEKILLMAQQGKDQDEVIRAVYNILESCIKTPMTITDLPVFDVEWLFLQLRGKSVSEDIEVRLKHSKEGCGGVTDVVININDIEVTKPNEKGNIVELEGGLGLTMKYPTLKMVDLKKFEDTPQIQDIFALVQKCVVNVFDKDQVYNDFTPDELQTFLEQLDQKQFMKISDFFTNSPKVRHSVKYKCSKCGEEVEYHLEGLMDFFL